MDILTLKARPRTGTGKSYTRKVRQQGWIPAVYYGHSRDSKNIEVDANEFMAIVRAKQTTHIIDLKLPNEEGDSKSIIKEIQRHTLNTSCYFHVDFQHVSMDEKISVECPVVVIGTAIGVKEDNGVLSQQTRKITIECLPTDIPDHIEIDVSKLHVGSSIHVSDIEIPKAEIKDSPEEVIVTVVQAQVAATPTTEVAEGEEGEDTEAKAEDDTSEAQEK